MPEFKKRQDKDCSPNGGFFNKLNDSTGRLVVKTAKLKAPIAPVRMVQTVRKIAPDGAKMCVGSRFMTFELDSGGKIYLDNDKLMLQCSGLTESEMIIVANGVFVAPKDFIIVRSGVF
ncbi:Uncharacterised protein [uncultured archaeon]|nr:Uncharacterised protein [uncultured archaeon]